MRRFVLGWEKFGLRQSLGSRIVTYADDLVILCRRGKAEEALHWMRELIDKLKLTVNEDKTRICKVPEGEFDFLGYTFGTNVLSNDGPSPLGSATVKEEHPARGRKGPRADRPSTYVARNHRAGRHVEPHAARMGELLLSRDRHSGVSGARQLCGCAVASVVALQAQDQTKQGRQLSTLAPLRDLRARASDPAWTRRAVDEGVKSCPRAQCGKSARCVR